MKSRFLQFFSLMFIFSWQLSIVAVYPDYDSVYVNDWANLLDVKAERKIIQDLKVLRAESDVEITLVTIGRMSDYPDTKRSIEGFALDLFNQWQVGNVQKNDGVLVLVSRYDRKMRIATGKAYDAGNKNAISKSIIDNYFIPSFKRDQYQQGILNGMDKVIQEFNPNASLAVGLLDSAQFAVKKTTNNAWSELKNSDGLLFFVIMGGIVLINLLKAFFSILFTQSPESKNYYVRPNYLIDKQAKFFKPTFPDKKTVAKKPYFVAFFLGIIALVFFAAFIGFDFAKLAFFALVAGLGVSFGIKSLFVFNRNKAKVCPRCNNSMDRLNEVNEDKHLELPERVEESLKSVDYDVWLCGNCRRTKKLRFPYWLSSIKQCKQCEYETLEIDINTLKTATTSHEGLEEIIEDCKYCDYHHEYEKTIPRIPDDDDDFGSGSGGSFGGGSSSGGGASGSW